MRKIQKLLWAMTALSVLGLIADLVVASHIGSPDLQKTLIAPVIFTGILLALCVILYFMVKVEPFLRGNFRQEIYRDLVLLGVQMGYCWLMLTGKVSAEAGTWGDIFAFLGYIHVFILAYRFNQKKKAVENLRR